MKKWLVTERLVLIQVIEAETKAEAIDAWNQTKADIKKGSITAKMVAK